MNILIISRYYLLKFGGGEMNDRHLGGALRAEGHTVRYLAGQTLFSGNSRLDSDVAVVRSPYLYPLSWFLPKMPGKLMRHLDELLFLRAMAKQSLDELRWADLVLITGRPILTGVKRFTRAKIIYSNRGPQNSFYRSAMERADGIIYWGGSDADIDFSVNQKHSIRLYPAIDKDIFNRKNEAGRGEQTDPASLRTKHILFVGRLEPIKQVELLIAAHHELMKCGYDAHLTIIGTGTQEAKLRQLVKELGLSKHMEFTGFRQSTEVASAMKASDVLVLTSSMENFPIVFLESLNCGCPVVGPPVGRIPAIVNQGQNGVLIDEMTPLGIAQAIIKAFRVDRTRLPVGLDILSWKENAQRLLQFASGFGPGRQC